MKDSGNRVKFFICELCGSLSKPFIKALVPIQRSQSGDYFSLLKIFQGFEDFFVHFTDEINNSSTLPRRGKNSEIARRSASESDMNGRSTPPGIPSCFTREAPYLLRLFYLCTVCNIHYHNKTLLGLRVKPNFTENWEKQQK